MSTSPTVVPIANDSETAALSTNTAENASASAPGSLSKSTKIIIGVVLGLLLLTGLGIGLYFLLRKKDECKASSDCKDAARPNCVAKKCQATDYCSPTCSGGTPFCVNNGCVACRSSDDCKYDSLGRTTCSSSSVCVAPPNPNPNPPAPGPTPTPGPTPAPSPSPTPALAALITAFLAKYSGKLVKCATSNSTYLIDGGVKRVFDFFERLDGWKLANPTRATVVTLSGTECTTLNAVTEGPKMDNKYQTIPASHNGYPVVCGDKSIYILENGSLHYLSAEAWAKWVQNNPRVSASAIYRTTQEECDRNPKGEDFQI